MKLPRALDRPATAPDASAMTPLIDVVFQLLLFFICAATGQLRYQVLDVNLPEGGVAAPQMAVAQPLGRVLCQLEQQEEKTVYRIEGRVLDSAGEVRRLFGTLAEISREIPVILDVGSQVPMGRVVDVYDAARHAGFSAVSFAIDR